MGGCRCTFRNCDNSTQNNPSMHFFHFPFRDIQRCEKWAEYSNNLAFLQLPISQLRNKVVCEIHFKEPCFMNIKHERLTKFAIPTLLRAKSGEIVDLQIDQSNPTIYDVQKVKTSKHYEPPTYNSTIKLLNNRASKVQSASALREEPTASDTFVEAATFEFADQCQEEDLNESVEISEQTIVESEADEPTLLNGITLTKVEINRFDPDCESDAAPTYTKLKRKIQPAVKSKVQNDRAISKDTAVKVDYDEPEIEYLEYSSKRPKFFETDNLVDKSVFADTMEKQKKEIADLKKIISDKLDKLEDSVVSKQSALLQQQTPVTQNANDKPSRNIIEAGPTKTKIQLFNGIKKYLNPSMVALLRMEMFGDTDRQYKSDEKSLAVELLNVQSNIYEYMRSELRFRLPPKKDAESWAKEMSENGREIDWEDEF
ncbi:hypothetical protein HA402_000062 [Bradysia odoriphaga]|nr:hypothetical protein HA402_000062 [Bradysia odoriphaga]